MKVLFFFFLLLPAVSALAVSPTSIDVTDGSKAVLYVYNTLNQEMYFEINGLHKENFTLAAGEKKIIEISVSGERPGHYEGEIIVKEISEGSFVNAIVIPVEYSGTMPQIQQKVFTTKIAFYFLSLVLILSAFLIYSYKKRKKDV